MKVKKIGAVLLALVLSATTLGACSGSNKGSSSENKGPATASSETTGNKMVGNMFVEGVPIVKDKETFTIAVSKEATSKNTFAEKEASKYTENMTNVHIEWQEIASSGWKEKVNIMLASGDLPDAFLGHVDVMKNIDAFASISDPIQKYAPNIREMFEGQPELLKAVTAPDGKVYTLPINRMDSANQVLDGLWMNKTWLAKLNLQVPTTSDEFVTVLKAFKEKDPNGNGEADEIPLGALQGNTGSNIDPLFGPFGASDTPEYVYTKDPKDGKVVFSGTQDGYFEGLKWLNKLYSEGLLDPECFTMTTAQFTAKAQNKDLLYGSVMYWLPDSMDPRFGDDYVTVPPLKGPSGQKPLWNKAREPIGEMAGFTITTKCKKPEVLVRYYDNNIANMENLLIWLDGPEGIGMWKKVDGGKWTETNEFVPKDANLGEFKRTIAAGPSSPAYIWSKWADLKVPDARNAKKIAANTTYMTYAVGTMPYGLEDPNKANQRNILFVDIDNYMKKFKANAVVQGITDAQWQEHLKKCSQLKVDEYTALWQEFYNSKK